MWRLLVAVVVLAGCDKVFGLEHINLDGPPPPRPDAPPGACGTVGTACCTSGQACTDGSQCLDLGTGHAGCMLFAGTYQSTTPGTCQPMACESDDPFSSTPCTCPTGFTAETATIDSGCGDVNSPSPQPGTITMCAVDALPTSSDFGGWFVTADLPDCEPGHPDGCTTPNAQTGTCRCPSPTQAVALRVWVPGTLGPSCQNGELGGTLGVCLDTTVAVASIRGVYETDPDNTCRAHSPGIGCKCPPGSLESTLHTITDRVVGNTTLFMRSTITFCLAPP